MSESALPPGPEAPLPPGPEPPTSFYGSERGWAHLTHNVSVQLPTNLHAARVVLRKALQTAAATKPRRK